MTLVEIRCKVPSCYRLLATIDDEPDGRSIAVPCCKRHGPPRLKGVSRDQQMDNPSIYPPLTVFTHELRPLIVMARLTRETQEHLI